ncbi:MAG: family 43 glycosylhydrolase [Lentisphaeria bacterium]|nr:family 43 glycosylhydrolase [Lentisphaeria bacterium]
MSQVWCKFPGNPVIAADKWGTIFDPFILECGGAAKRFRMYLSWRPQNAIALVESDDGIQWSEPRIVLGASPRQDLREFRINRACVIALPDGRYRMYYSGQGPDRNAPKHACIFAAESDNGIHWKKIPEFMFSPDGAWQGHGVMCPHVIYDAEAGRYKMWYSGMNNPGAYYEPDAIGYAESRDGLSWEMPFAGPVFRAEDVPGGKLIKVTAAQVSKDGGYYYMFYIGFESHSRATICLGRSRTGTGDWEAHPGNPIVAPDAERWDHDACYKPAVCVANGKVMLWYNGRKASTEQIGLVCKDGTGFW